MWNGGGVLPKVLAHQKIAKMNVRGGRQLLPHIRHWKTGELIHLLHASDVLLLMCLDLLPQ